MGVPCRRASMIRWRTTTPWVSASAYCSHSRAHSMCPQTKWPRGRGGGMQGSATRTPLTEAGLATAAAECPVCRQPRLTLSPVVTARCLGAGGLHWTSSIREGAEI